MTAGGPLDGRALKKLAHRLMEGGTYPWSDRDLEDAHVDSATLGRLERSGWLRTLYEQAGPRFELIHNRLLNWLIAETLVDDWQAGETTTVEIGRRLSGFLARDESVAGRNMGFVAMDVLWIASHCPALACHLPELLAMLEEHPVRDDVLYGTLVPTLGPRIGDALLARLRAVLGDRYRSSLIAPIVATIVGSAAAMRLLDSDDPLEQRAALQILSANPEPTLLDRTWTLHVAMSNDPTRFCREHEDKYDLYRESFAALRSACQIKPEWLEDAIARANPALEPVHDLAYVIAAVSGQRGREVWLRRKSTLFGKVLAAKQRSLASCVQEHGDSSDIPWLVEQLSRSEDFVGAQAMAALSRLEPNTAIAELAQLSARMLALTAGWYVDVLFASCPSEMTAALLHMMQRTDDPWEVAAVYHGREHFLDPATLDFLLDELVRQLDETVAAQDGGRSEPLYSELTLLARVNNIDSLERFAARRDRALERLLTAFLLRIGPRKGIARDSLVREPALDVLYRIQGDGFTRVVNAFLKADSRFGLLDAIRLSGKRPDSETIQLLSEIVKSSQTWDGYHLNQNDAATVLAELGVWEPVLGFFAQMGVNFSNDLTALGRAGFRPPPELADTVRRRIRQQASLQPGDIVQLGFTGGTDDVPFVRHVLGGCPPESELAHACVIALELLSDEAEESVSLLAVQLRHHSYSATNALIMNGSHLALQALRNHNERGLEVAVAINLINHSSNKDVIINEVRSQLEAELEKRGFWDFNVNLAMLIRHIPDEGAVQQLLDSASIKEHLRTEAFADEGSGWFTGTKEAAIRCLARFDIQKAFLAAKVALANHDWHDRDRYPYLLMELSPSQAVTILMDQLHAERDPTVARSIGRALCGADIDPVLHEWLASEDARLRRTAILAAGWAGRSSAIEARLRELLRDTDDAVVSAAADSLKRIRRNLESDRLATALLNESDPSRRWVLLDCLLDLDDPGDSHQLWPVRGAPVRDALSSLQIKYAVKALQERRDEVARQKDIGAILA